MDHQRTSRMEALTAIHLLLASAHLTTQKDHQKAQLMGYRTEPPTAISTAQRKEKRTAIRSGRVLVHSLLAAKARLTGTLMALPKKKTWKGLTTETRRAPGLVSLILPTAFGWAWPILPTACRLA